MITPGSALQIVSVLMIVNGLDKGNYGLTAIGIAIFVFFTTLQFFSNRRVEPYAHFSNSDVQNVYDEYQKQIENGRPENSK